MPGQARPTQPMTKPTPKPMPMPAVSPAARWVVAAAVAVFAILGAVQSQQHSSVVAGSFVVAVGSTLFMDPGRPWRFTVFAVLSAVGVAVLANGNAANVGWFGVCVLGGWFALVRGPLPTVVWWLAAVTTFGAQWWWTTRDRGWAAWVAGATFTAVGFWLARRDRELAHRLRLAQAGLAERVRAEERNRIARELHDVIAHSLTVSLLHVSSARLAVEEDPATAVLSLAEAERLGRECLAEVRQVVGLLRHEEGTSTAPLPGAAQLNTLVEQFRTAGVDVALTVHGNPDELTSTLGLALYRILQEALTNAARHAPGTGTRAELAITSAKAVLTVDSAGQPGSGTGSGLDSMRERAQVLGGVCTAGPTPTGWRVRAELPRTSEPHALAYP